MLSAAKHLEAQRERPFAAAQGDKQGASSVDSYWATARVARGWGILPVYFAHSKGHGHASIPGG